MRRHFCYYCLQAFSTAEILKSHAKDYFKINDNQMIKIPLKSEHVRFKNYERRIKSPFLIYADFESILVSKDHGEQNTDESYTNKYQKHIACSHGYKLECVDDKFRESFKS